MIKFWNFLQGKKLYITGVAMVTYAFSGMFLGNLEVERGVEMIFAALALVGVKSALKKLER